MIKSMSGPRAVFAVALFFVASTAVAQRGFDTDILKDTFGYDEDTQKSVSLADLKQGCPRRDCIPSIDNPKYVSAQNADHVADDDIVLALSWKGYHRAWPARILDLHEIVNDFIAGTPIAITWCPLCGSAVGVLREIDGRVSEFGVSGLLLDSNLVFYDRRTGTLWDQIGGTGIVGPLTGTKLEFVPVTMTRWGKWKAAHPDTLVLSSDTGFRRDYTRDVYKKYRSRGRLMFAVANTSDAIRPKSVVFGFDLGDRAIAIVESALQPSSTIDREVEGQDYGFSLAEDGTVTMTDRVSGDVYPSVRSFWFAWYTFHPETELVR
jgi:uncharacterized protein DUF3179